MLRIEAVHNDLLIEVLHVEVGAQRDVHFIGHIEPPEFLAVRTVGDAVVELRGNGVAADHVYVIDQGVGGHDRPYILHCGAYAHGGEGGCVGLFVQTDNLQIAETVIHELRPPFFACFVTAKGVFLIGVGRPRVEILHIHAAVGIEAFAAPQTDFLSGPALQAETILARKVASEIHHTQRIASAADGLHTDSRPFLHHPQRFVHTAAQHAVTAHSAVRTLEMGRHDVHRLPLREVRIRIADAGNLQSGVIILTAPPV